EGGNEFEKPRAKPAARSRTYAPSPRRPCESRDPYAAAEIVRKKWSTALLQQQPTVAMGPCFRRDDTTSVTQSLPPHRQRDQAEGADDHAPPGEQHKAVAGDIVQERLHHDDRGDERHHETDRDNAEVIRRHVTVALVE